MNPGLRARAEVHALPDPRSGVATCVCQNLAIASDAFARLSNEEIFSLPLDLRRRAHGALLGVWQILDLVQRLEELDGAAAAEEAAFAADREMNGAFAADGEMNAALAVDRETSAVFAPDGEMNAALAANRWRDADGLVEAVPSVGG